MSEHRTADLCDRFETAVRVCQLPFVNYGGRVQFSGNIATIACQRDNGLIRTVLSEPGRARVLVVDAGGVRDCALVGGNLGELAVRNGWSGIIVHGAIRDRHELAPLALGVCALGSYPQRGTNHGGGRRDVPVAFGDMTFEPHHWLCADLDGLITLEKAP